MDRENSWKEIFASNAFQCTVQVHPRNGVMATIAANDNREDGYYPMAQISWAGGDIVEAGTACTTGCASFADGNPMKIEVLRLEGSRQFSTLCR